MKEHDFDLPNGFKFRDLPITTVTLRELDGEDEDLVRDRNELKKGNILDKLVKRCIVRLGSFEKRDEIEAAYEYMPLPDLTFTLIRLRQSGMDNVYRFEMGCPSCGKPSRHRIDLRELACTPQKEEYRFKNDISVTLSNGSVVSFRPLIVRDQKQLEEVKEQYAAEKGTRELIVQLNTYDGKNAKDFALVRKLPWAVRNEIRQAMDDASGGIDTELVMDCPKCDHTFEKSMPVDVRDFFFQTGGTGKTCSLAKPCRPSGFTQPSSPSAGAGAQKASEG